MISSRSKIIALLTTATTAMSQAMNDTQLSSNNNNVSLLEQLLPLFVIGGGFLGFTVTKCILNILNRRDAANASTVAAQGSQSVELQQEAKSSALDGKEQIQDKNNAASLSSVPLEINSLFAKPEQVSSPITIEEGASIKPTLPCPDNVVIFHV